MSGTVYHDTLFTSSKTDTTPMLTTVGDWESQLEKLRQVLLQDPHRGRAKMAGLHALSVELQCVRDEQYVANLEDLQKAYEEREVRRAEKIATAGLGGTPWCREGDEDFKQMMDKEESKLRATSAWLPVVSVGQAAPTPIEFSQDLTVREVRGETLVARGWCLGMTSWDDAGVEMEEWVPSTAAAQEQYAKNCRRRDARILAFEMESGWNEAARALRPQTSMATAGRFLRAALHQKSFQDKAAEALKAQRDASQADRVAKAAERHAINRQRREAGLDNTYTRDGIEEVRHEEESFFTAKSGGAFQVRRRRQHKNIKNKNNTGERWCHDGYRELKDFRSHLEASYCSAGVVFVGLSPSPG